jgi:archaellum component FlaF (FlaF/FlaG flagellin family)
MESAVSSLILFTVMLFAILTFAHDNMATQDLLSASEQAMEVRRLDQARTALTVTNAQTTNAGALIEVTLRNSGETMLADYDRWDVIVEHYYQTDPETTALAVDWLPYTATGAPSAPGANQWTVGGIYTNAATYTPEAFDLGIFNPGEEMIVQMMVAPSVALTTTNRATIGVANGTSVAATVVR